MAEPDETYHGPQPERHDPEPPPHPDAQPDPQRPQVEPETEDQEETSHPLTPGVDDSVASGEHFDKLPPTGGKDTADDEGEGEVGGEPPEAC